MKDAQWLLDRLPPCEPIARRTEADFYGASDLIRTALGLDATPPSSASWKHGVTYAQDWRYPELMLTEGNRLTRHLVFIQSQVLRLKARGFARVHAVGAPILYAEPHSVARVPRSLLVMPAHSVFNSQHAFDENSYVQSLLAIGDKFDVLLACVAAPDVRKGQWVRVLERHGIPWITGADSTDRNALRRIGRLFDSFEFVTTNTLGSHVAYAAFRGCKVSLWGPIARYRLEDFRGVPWYEQNWDRAMEVIESLSEESIRRRHPFLFTNPWQARSLEAWAADLLGVANKRDPAELARLLGWTPTGQAEALIHRAARRAFRLGQAVVRRASRPSLT